MKQCTLCKLTKPLAAFHRHRSRRDGRQTICIDCKRIYNRTYYEQNGPRHLELRRTQRARRRERALEVIARAKDVPCADCGQRFAPEAMDFDHVRGRKAADVSGMRGMGLQTLQLEIAKCDVVCVCCHRQRTRHRRLRRMVAASYGWVPRDSNSEPIG